MNAEKAILVVILILLLIFFFAGALVRPGFGAGSGTEELYTRRLALLVGANDGGKGRTVLRYAVDDARAVGRVLEDMGGVLAGDSRYLDEPDRASLLGTLAALAADVDRAKGVSRRVEVIFYYSGHSDEEALFLGEERIPYEELKDIITSLNADVRIAIVDSCASGALTLPKGVVKRPPFLMDTAYDMRGYAFVTSSSASEAAQESSRLGRSFFTHNLISGLRGAADMNLDGRITLNEAYQFAFDGTLAQTERTMAGAQHPSRHVQMSGTGDVVITEVWKSAAVLVFESGFAGKIYVHNKSGLLVVELNKTAGREVSIGLDAGEYRIFAVDSFGALEAKVSLENGKSRGLNRSHFAKAARLPAALRGAAAPAEGRRNPGSPRFGWRLELTGGLAAVSPSDLNLRGTYDQMNSAFYGNDYLTYLVSQGKIVAFVKRTEGAGIRHLGTSVPFGLLVRRRLASWLDVSLGLTHFSGSRTSANADFYDVTELDGRTTIYTNRFDDYTLAVQGYLPQAGIHLGGNITPSLRLEAGLTGGPLFASCRYAFRYQSNLPDPASTGNDGAPEAGMIEEKGKGVGPAFHLGAKLDYQLTQRYGVFVEGGYAFQVVPHVSGPGMRAHTGKRDTWEGEWAMKQRVTIEPWGTGRFLWPSNGWELFRGDWWRSRDFKLDLSGFQAKVGLFFRF